MFYQYKTIIKYFFQTATGAKSTLVHILILKDGNEGMKPCYPTHLKCLQILVLQAKR